MVDSTIAKQQEGPWSCSHVEWLQNPSSKKFASRVRVSEFILL